MSKVSCESGVVGMKFWITQNPRVSLMLLPWFVEVDQKREDMYLELRQRLTYNPDETFVCLAIEGDLIKGMAIAYCRLKDVFIWQAHMEKGVLPRVVDAAFDCIKQWARDKGFHRVSGGPNRAKKIWARRWGFRESEENKDEVYLEV